MGTLNLTISRSVVMEEVAKLTDYVGSKADDGNDNARDRIMATDNALSDMSRFWSESITMISDRLKSMITGSSLSGNGEYQLRLEVSRSFDTSLGGQVQSGLTGFMVNYITAQWFKIANKGEAEEYARQGMEFLNSAERLLYSRKRPTLPAD